MGKSVYLIAALLTAVVFLLVFSFVRFDESSRIEELSSQIQNLYEEQQANKILSSYLDKTDSNSCAIYETQISKQLNRIYSLFSQLEKVNDMTFTVSKAQVKRQYLIASMSLWLDLRDASKFCKMEIKPILFFLPDSKDCVDCDAMISQLEELKRQCGNARVFAFPSESQDFEFVSLLEKDYNVTKFPSIVANNKTYSEVVDIAILKKDLNCS